MSTLDELVQGIGSLMLRFGDDYGDREAERPVTFGELRRLSKLASKARRETEQKPEPAGRRLARLEGRLDAVEHWLGDALSRLGSDGG